MSVCRIQISNMPDKQSGVTLIVGLVMLVLITMVGIMSLKTGSFEERMSGNMRDKGIAFQAAESSLTTGEDWIEALANEPIPSAGCVQPCVIPHDNTFYIEDQTNAWWDANTNQLDGGTISQVSSQPQYYLEFIYFQPDDLTIGMGTSSGRSFYYISAKGSGASNDASSVLQSTYTRRF